MQKGTESGLEVIPASTAFSTAAALEFKSTEGAVGPNQTARYGLMLNTNEFESPPQGVRSQGKEVFGL